MKAIQIQQTGGPEVLVLREIDALTPGAGEVLVKIEAAGINFIDVYFREGRYKAQVPFIPGQEAAGIVVETGAGVTRFKPGDRVAWCSVSGTYAEYAKASAEQMIAIPDGLDFRQAAALMLQGMTAHYLCKSVFSVKPGDEVLVHAGAGGVGLLLIQMVKMLGGYVFTTTSTETKAELARAAGADEVILYTQQNFAEAIKEKTKGKLLQCVYDSVGASTFEDSLRCLAPRGLMALFGGSSGAVPPFDLIRLSQMGSLFVTRPRLQEYTATREELEWRAGDVLQWAATGKLKTRIEHVYPLADAALAHRDLESRKTSGKLLLIP